VTREPPSVGGGVDVIATANGIAAVEAARPAHAAAVRGSRQHHHSRRVTPSSYQP
jgi:hypothetical protein